MGLKYITNIILFITLFITIICVINVNGQNGIESILSPTSTLLAVNPPSGQIVDISWVTRTDPPVTPGQYMSLIAREAIKSSDSTLRCPSTIEEKQAALSQIIAPAIPIDGRKQWKTSNFPTLSFETFCLYFQQSFNLTSEVGIRLNDQLSLRYHATQSLSFCKQCKGDDGSRSLGCDPITRQCYCKPDSGLLTKNCLNQQEYSASTPGKANCVSDNVDLPLSEFFKECTCTNFWSGSTCSRCSLSDCSGWTATDTQRYGQCKTCAAVGSGEPNVPNEDCSRCKCTNPYSRGVTCGCRGAIFDILPSGTQFSLPYGNVTSVSPTTSSTQEEITAEAKKFTFNQIFLINLRLSLAMDLNIPLSSIEIIHYQAQSIRFAVSPWCQTEFPKITERSTPHATRQEQDGGAPILSFILQDPISFNNENIYTTLSTLSSSSTSSESQEVVQKLQQLKTQYQTLFNRSPLDTTQQSKDERYDTLSNTNDAPFIDLYNRINTNLIDGKSTSYTLKALNVNNMDAQQIYFQNCVGNDICSQLGPDHYAVVEKSYTLIIIIVVIVAVVIVLALSVVLCLYCNSKKLCCFKAIHEYNERKKRKEAEKAAQQRDGSGSTPGTGSRASSEKPSNQDGSNSSRPKNDSASGGQLTSTNYHGSSTSAIDQRNSGSSTPGYGSQLRRTSATPSSPASPGGRSVSRRTSQGGRGNNQQGVEMTQRRTSRGGRSRGQSRAGGLRASNAAATLPPGGMGSGNPDGDQNLDDAELPVGWERAVAQDGKTYYVNTETLTSQWTHPSIKIETKEISEDSLEAVIPE